jgi:LPXTG-site transpeptidase (sortase) family protein
MQPEEPNDTIANDSRAPAPNGTAGPLNAAQNNTPAAGSGSAQAVEVIRQKIARLYGDEPDAKEEIQDTRLSPEPRSKHQAFLLGLSNSGQPKDDIQRAWHQYYAGLPDHEKREVWEEFYAVHSHTKQTAHAVQQPATEHKPAPAEHQPQPHHPAPEPAGHAPKAKIERGYSNVFKPRSISEELARELEKLSHPKKHDHPKEPGPTVQAFSSSPGEIKQGILGKIEKRSQRRKQHAQSLFFGVSMGALTLLILLFGLFNERFIAPFITPSRTVSSTPIIIDPTDTIAGTNESEVVIPKINVEIPVVYDLNTIDEAAIQKSLERGVVHYSTTAMPGQRGNVVIFGHSSNNIFNPGKYKFAFVLLSRLEAGDTFMLTKDGKRYVYRIFDKKIVKPTDVDILTASQKSAQAMLITCDPPGTSLNRLVVTGEQITPDPAGNAAPQPQVASNIKQLPTIPSDSPSLWQRISSWF